jgi:hypothetical protein
MKRSPSGTDATAQIKGARGRLTDAMRRHATDEQIVTEPAKSCWQIRRVALFTEWQTWQ